MSNIVVFGSQWGDEGKGKIVDMLAEQADAIVRFQGGNNAGHTLVVEGEQCILHLIPSGVLHPGKKCLIGNGVVLDPVVFCEELDKLAAKGIDVSPARMMISKKTHVIMPYHRLMDAAREAAKSDDGKIGTTGRGIGPCYEDKMNRCGIRARGFRRHGAAQGQDRQRRLRKRTFCSSTSTARSPWKRRPCSTRSSLLPSAWFPTWGTYPRLSRRPIACFSRARRARIWTLTTAPILS